jgi:hypothetical protein
MTIDRIIAVGDFNNALTFFFLTTFERKPRLDKEETQSSRRSATAFKQESGKSEH